MLSCDVIMSLPGSPEEGGTGGDHFVIWLPLSLPSPLGAHPLQREALTGEGMEWQPDYKVATTSIAASVTSSFFRSPGSNHCNATCQ